MSPANVIEKSSNLRILPLPGRYDSAAPGAIAPAARQQNESTQAAQTDGTLAVAGRSQQAENFLYVSYGPISVAQAANLQLLIPRPAYASGRQTLADHVVNQLLHDRETQAEKGSAPRGAGAATHAVGRYQSAAGGFPHSADSLFSLIS